MKYLFDRIESSSLTLTEAWEWLMNNKDNLIQKEKEQIIEAWSDGLTPNDLQQMAAEKYYKQKYGDNHE